MSAKVEFEAKKLVTGYGDKTIIDGINVRIPKNKISVIIGANACGKSTLLKTMSRLIKADDGVVSINGKNITKMKSKELAKLLGLLAQSPVVPEGITVADLVARGRFPHQSIFSSMNKEDFDAVEEALEIMGISELADINMDELSGGQRQRVWIAMALAQQTDILILDEPTTYLDITYQIEILDLLTDLNRKRGTTILMVLHDINLSSRYADYMFALKNGKLVDCGTPEEIINKDLIKDVFGLECEVIKDPVSLTPFIVPRGRHHIKN